jgi:FixJ family two-component response regulator
MAPTQGTSAMIPTPTADRRNPDCNLGPVVVIVNSDESARTWIEAMVVSTGLRALTFKTAAELLASFKPETAACAILDVVLPDASGLELQDNLARAGLSVMFITREHCISSCVRAVKAGAVDFLIMPCDANQLVESLRYAVRHAHSLWSQRVQHDELRSRYQQLTRREREVFALVSTGLLNKQIAQRLDISEITVQIHRGRVMRKMRADSFASLVRMADALRPETRMH